MGGQDHPSTSLPSGVHATYWWQIEALLKFEQEIEMQELRTWETPHGTISARIYEAYIGLYGQVRVGLADRQGRVWHYNASELTPSPLMASRGWKLWSEVMAQFDANTAGISWHSDAS